MSGSLTANSDGTYNGSLTVNVSKADKHAKADKGTTKTYTLASPKVKLHGENPAALTANSRVNLRGTITTLTKKRSADEIAFVCERADELPTRSPARTRRHLGDGLRNRQHIAAVIPRPTVTERGTTSRARASARS